MFDPDCIRNMLKVSDCIWSMLVYIHVCVHLCGARAQLASGIYAYTAKVVNI